jgi:hypothetical protein
LRIDLLAHDFRRSIASFRVIAGPRRRGRRYLGYGHANIATMRRQYAAYWREAEERTDIVLRKLADAGIGQ